MGGSILMVIKLTTLQAIPRVALVRFFFFKLFIGNQSGKHGSKRVIFRDAVAFFTCLHSGPLLPITPPPRRPILPPVPRPPLPHLTSPPETLRCVRLPSVRSYAGIGASVDRWRAEAEKRMRPRKSHSLKKIIFRPMHMPPFRN